jgi:hypothetical protein
MAEAIDVLVQTVQQHGRMTRQRGGGEPQPHCDGCGLDWCGCRERREWRDALGARKERCAWSGGAQKCGAQKWDAGERSAARAGGIGQAEGSDRWDRTGRGFGPLRASSCVRDVLSRLGRVSSTVAEVCIRHHVSPIFSTRHGHLSAGSDASVGDALGRVFGGLGLIVGMEE